MFDADVSLSGPTLEWGFVADLLNMQGEAFLSICQTTLSPTVS